MALPRWRVWTYRQPAVVLGCSQRALYERTAASNPSLEVLLRESGGGAVLTGPWLVSLSVVLPPGHIWLGQGLLEGYRHLGGLHVEALADLGVPATAVPPAQVSATRAALAARGVPALEWACFGSLSPWELVDADGRKLVGLAQRHARHGVLLVAGTLVAEPDWDLLCHALGRPEAATVLRQQTGSCGQSAGRAVPPEAVAGALARRLSGALGSSC